MLPVMSCHFKHSSGGPSFILLLVFFIAQAIVDPGMDIYLSFEVFYSEEPTGDDRMMLMRWKVDIMRTIIGGLLATSLGVKPLFPRCAQEREKKKKKKEWSPRGRSGPSRST